MPTANHLSAHLHAIISSSKSKLLQLMVLYAQVVKQSEDDMQYCKRCRTSKPDDAFTQGYLQCDACRDQQRRNSKVCKHAAYLQYPNGQPVGTQGL